MKKLKTHEGVQSKSLLSFKILKVMRNTLILLFLPVLQILAGNSYSQTTKLSLDLKNTSLENVLDEIERQSEVYFVFNYKLVDVKQQVDVQADNQPISDILASLFDGSKVDYIVLDRQILLSPREYLLETKSVLQPVTITGTVTDENGEPLPGVSISIKGTTRGTVTDLDGNYAIEVKDPSAMLVFSYVGHISQTITVSDQKIIDVTMEADIFGLEEVVVIGYGTIRKSDLTGSVSTVKGDVLENVPASRVDQILQGKAAGVQVTQIDGTPGSGSSIRIRGGNSVQGDNEPLYVIDGFIVGTAYNLNNLNVNDIESIEVLKDATAISIYGTRGANGVIIITTKSGLHQVPAGQSVVTVNAYTGILL